jgi:hypothetical protein
LVIGRYGGSGTAAKRILSAAEVLEIYGPNLHPLGDADIRGRTQVLGDSIILIALDVAGLSKGRVYPLELRAGSCATGGPLLLSLNPVVGTAGAISAGKTQVHIDQIASGQAHSVTLYSPEKTALACGDLKLPPR